MVHLSPFLLAILVHVRFVQWIYRGILLEVPLKEFLAGFSKEI